MATSVPFPEANRVLRAPDPVKSAYDLQVRAWSDDDGVPRLFSKWQLAPEEIAALQENGGVLWLHLVGDTHPPVSIETWNPFDPPGPLEEGPDKP